MTTDTTTASPTLSIAQAAGSLESVLCPFEILRDSRESAPWFFRGFHADAKQAYRPLEVRTHWQYLGNGLGDYTIAGAEDAETGWKISIERKSLTDLYGTILGRRERFVHELEMLSKMQYAAVVIEAGWPQIASFDPQHWDRQGLTERQRISRRKSVIRSITAWMTRYRVQWLPMPSRRAAESITFRLLQSFWREYMQNEES